MPTTAVHIIGGSRVGSTSGNDTLSDVNPATGEVLCEIPLGGLDAVDAAVAAAKQAFPAWSATPVGERCQVLFRYKQVLEDHFDELADMIVSEHGKTVGESRGDVRRGIDCIEYACGAPSLLMGRTLPRIAVSSSFSREREENIPLDSTMERLPLGVCAGITPFQLSDHGAHVDVAYGDRLWEHVCAQAQRESIVVCHSRSRVGQRSWPA